MEYLSIKCPHCGVMASWPASIGREGESEHFCSKCNSVFVKHREGDIITTRVFAENERSAYPEPTERLHAKPHHSVEVS